MGYCRQNSKKGYAGHNLEHLTKRLVTQSAKRKARVKSMVCMCGHNVIEALQVTISNIHKETDDTIRSTQKQREEMPRRASTKTLPQCDYEQSEKAHACGGGTGEPQKR